MAGAAFTMRLKDVIEMRGGTANIDPESGIRKLVPGPFFDAFSHFPIFDEEYRDTLVGKIVDHYYLDEIGVETVDMFCQNMRVRLNEIMPYYNDLYKTTRLEIDPFLTVKLATKSKSESKNLSESSAEAEGDTNSATEAVGKSRAVNSSTPQTQLTRNKDYATSGADSRSSNESSATANEHNTSSSSTEDTQTAANESETTGYQGVPAELITQFRQAILNIDMMVINALEDLFMLVYSSGNSFTSNGRTYTSWLRQ
jgi:hypothetical protein